MRDKNNPISIEWMPNGLILVFDYTCQWSGVYNANGTYRHGEASRYSAQVKAWLGLAA